jgi:hypothetical protein
MIVKPLMVNRNDGFIAPIIGEINLKRGDSVKIVNLKKLYSSNRFATKFETRGGWSGGKQRTWDIPPTQTGIVKEVKQNPLILNQIICYVSFGATLLKINLNNLQKI